MVILILINLLFSSNQHKDTVRIVIDSAVSQPRFNVIGDSSEILFIRNNSIKIQNIIQKFDQIAKENECDNFSSDTLDLQILTENTKSSKTRWVRAGPIFPYGENHLNELMELTKHLNPILHPNKIYKIQYLRYCKSKSVSTK